MSSICVLLSLINQRWASRYIASPWAKGLMLAVPGNTKIEGLENLDPKQSYVVVANHVSVFDICALYGWLNLDLKWVMKIELKKAPFIGPAAMAMGHIFLDRKNKQNAIQTLLDIKPKLSDGTSVLFFPEGTRSTSGRIKRFKRGAFMSAKTLELPILPITVLGTKDIMLNGTIDLTPGVATLVIHPPIGIDTVRNSEETELMQMAQDVVASALPEMEAA